MSLLSVGISVHRKDILSAEDWFYCKFLLLKWELTALMPQGQVTF